jgi:TPR repeat protein
MNLRLAALLVALLATTTHARAQWSAANDEANRQRMMSDMRANSAAADRRNAESLARSQADSARYRERSSTGSGVSSSSGASAGVSSWNIPTPTPSGPQSVVATYTFTVKLRETDAQVVARLKNEAAAGDVQAQYNLGRVYYTGYGTPRDDAAARRWFGDAARAGHPPAQAVYGYLLVSGVGGAVDAAEGFRSLKKAADAGELFGQAQYGFQRLNQLRDTPGAELDEAIGYLEKAAARGDGVANGALATVYQFGVGRTANVARAVEYTRAAADAGIPFAMTDLGARSLAGAGVPRDPVQGLAWIRRAVAAQHPDAMAQYGLMQLNGLDGVEKDVNAGAAMIEKAANAGSVPGMTLLAKLFYEGIGKPKDLRTAARWFKRAADAGDAESAEAIREPDIAAALAS